MPKVAENKTQRLWHWKLCLDGVRLLSIDLSSGSISKTQRAFEKRCLQSKPSPRESYRRSTELRYLEGRERAGKDMVMGKVVRDGDEDSYSRWAWTNGDGDKESIINT